jgi:hypothetical protein
MKRLLQLAIIIGIAILTVGLASAQTVGTTTATDGNGDGADNADCDGVDCDDDDVGTGLFGDDGFDCVQKDMGQSGDVSFGSWLTCQEAHYDWREDYYAEVLNNVDDTYSLVVGRNDGTDLEAICSWDNIDGIQGWTLSLSASDRIAKYKKLDAPTTGGVVYFKFNGTTIPVYYFASSYTKESFNDLLISRIELAGFDVEESPDYVRVSTPGPFASGITQFTMRLQSSELKELAVAIEPDNEVNELLCRWPGDE